MSAIESISDEEAGLLKKAITDASAATRATKVWRHILRPNVQSACVFVNTPQAQGAGEVSMSVRDDGQVNVFYFL